MAGVETRPKFWPQFVAALAGGFGAFCLGAAIGWTAPAERYVLTDNIFDIKPKPTSNDYGWISSVCSLGCAIVAIPTGMLVKRFGRKPVMLSVVLPFLGGWVLLIWGGSLAMLYVGRFVLGLCGGTFVISGPMYNTEIAQVKVRGLLGSFFQLFFVSGITYAYIIGGLFSFRNFNYLLAILPAIFFLLFVWMPESPAYNVLRGNEEEAARSLHWLRGANYDINEELLQIRAANAQPQIGLKDALKERAIVKGLCISITLMFFQQFTGSTAVIAYTTSIFEQSGSGIKPDISTIIMGLWFVLATIFMMGFIDVVGRKVLMIVSAIFMSLNSATIGLYFYLKQTQLTSVASLSWLPVFNISCFIVFYAFGLGPVPFIMMVELFGEHFKALGAGITGTIGAIFAFLSIKSYPIMVNCIGIAASFATFTFLILVALLFSVLVMPETKGKTLAEIQYILEGEKK